jgi:hypothetical protein
VLVAIVVRSVGAWSVMMMTRGPGVVWSRSVWSRAVWSRRVRGTRAVITRGTVVMPVVFAARPMVVMFVTVAMTMMVVLVLVVPMVMAMRSISLFHTAIDVLVDAAVSVSDVGIDIMRALERRGFIAHTGRFRTTTHVGHTRPVHTGQQKSPDYCRSHKQPPRCSHRS